MFQYRRQYINIYVHKEVRDLLRKLYSVILLIKQHKEGEELIV